jgi:CheY-like chemotaxis protein
MRNQVKEDVNILLVDDDEDDCLLVEEALKSIDLVNEFRVARDGKEMIEYLNGCKASSHIAWPDLILLDLNMPRQDGREALREMRADPMFRSIPVVIFTTSRAVRDVNLCYELGANAYLIKPMSFEGLAEMLSSLCSFWFRFATLPQARTNA